MNLAAAAVNQRTVTYFVICALSLAGAAAFFTLGQLEDPEFTVKTAVIVTTYPGASAEEVELEVTDKIELELQELKQIKNIRSTTKPGLSTIKVDIRSSYSSAVLPQIWDEMRRKVRDVEGSLPPGAGRPIVADDFGDVYGHLIAVTGDGFDYAELQGYVDGLKKELSLVEGVARVEIWGSQPEVVYLDVSQATLKDLGVSDSSVQQALQQQHKIVDAGSVDGHGVRLRIAPTGEFKSVADIGNLPIRPSTLDSLQSNAPAGHTSELLYIRDVAAVRRGYREPASQAMRQNGQPAIAIAITNVSGVNIVTMGQAVDKRLAELIPDLPVGIEIERVHWQANDVATAVSGFLINFAEAVLIVLVVLTIGMGWRMSLVIGTALVATILISLLAMSILGIDLQRMSLGALVVALGMMVDNAIVVADGFVVRLKKKVPRTEAAIQAAAMPSMPLLGATIIAVMAFYPIFASEEGAGEYCATLFTVVGISLMISWAISVTLTPVQCMDMLPDPPDDGNADPFAGGLFQKFRAFLLVSMRHRWVTMVCVIGMLIGSGIAFQNVKQLFFPDSAMSKFMIDYWGPEATRIDETSANMLPIEAMLMADDRVAGVSTFVGAGPPRFYLPVEPESANPAYGQLIVNVHDYRQINAIIEDLEPWLKENQPEALTPMRKFGVGPSNTWKFAVRISGPAVADAPTLRRLAGELQDILTTNPLVAAQQTDWRQRVKSVVPQYNQERGRWAGISRDDVANTTKRAFDGRVIGRYREGDAVLPIILRQVDEERQNVGGMDSLLVRPKGSAHTVPLGQVVDGVSTKWEDPMIQRRNRRRTITVQANPIRDVTLPTLRNSVLADLAKIPLPPGYKMDWGGEFESSRDAQKSLVPGVIPAALLVALIVVALFNEMKPPIVITLILPFTAIGIVVGLLVTGTPFGFLALLGGMSLGGMMIKNAIVLLDEANINLADGLDRYEAIVLAAVSRLRPVVLAAATTVLGVVPLLQDVFWVGLAVVVMFGLTFGTLLTMIVVPVLYAIIYRLKDPVPAADGG